MKMPGIDGLEVLKELRSRGIKTKVIIITAYGSIENAVEAMKLGAVDYITKPFSPQQLESSIKEVLNPPLKVSEPEVISKPKECVWAKAEVVSYRLCTLNFQCDKCEFAQSMIDHEGVYLGKEKPGIDVIIEKLRQRPGSERHCRYMLSENISFKLCPNVFQCYRCAFDQYIQDDLDRTAAKLTQTLKTRKKGS
jgi:CheY-like chemotaxis protein